MVVIRRGRGLMTCNLHLVRSSSGEGRQSDLEAARRAGPVGKGCWMENHPIEVQVNRIFQESQVTVRFTVISLAFGVQMDQEC